MRFNYPAAPESSSRRNAPAGTVAPAGAVVRAALWPQDERLGRVLINRECCAGSSGDFLPPSPPAEAAEAEHAEQPRNARAHDPSWPRHPRNVRNTDAKIGLAANTIRADAILRSERR